VFIITPIVVYFVVRCRRRNREKNTLRPNQYRESRASHWTTPRNSAYDPSVSTGPSVGLNVPLKPYVSFSLTFHAERRGWTEYWWFLEPCGSIDIPTSYAVGLGEPDPTPATDDLRETLVELQYRTMTQPLPPGECCLLVMRSWTTGLYDGDFRS
jgi:hypothetical protein